MNLEKQVIELSFAIKLKELGISQDESIFCYASGDDHEYNIVLTEGYEWSDYPCWSGVEFKYSAFTVGELGAMLDGAVTTELSLKNKWEAWPPRFVDSDDSMKFKCDTEADCRAMALIELISNGVLSVDKINERLL